MKKNLIVIRLDAIGDFILWLDAAKELREYYPKSKYNIIFIGNSIYSDLAHKCPYFDKFIPVKINNYLHSIYYRWYIRLKLLSLKAEIVLCPVYSKDYITDKLIKFTRSKNKIGFFGDFYKISKNLFNKGKKNYSTLLKLDESNLFELNKNSFFISKILNTDTASKLPDLSFCLKPLNKNRKDYYIIVPGAGAKYREWNIENYILIIDKIYNRYKLNPIICGSSKEKYFGKKIKSKCKYVTDLTGKTTILDLVNLINNSTFLISNETSAIHIGAALQIPAICILGGGHFARFMPYNLDSKIYPNLPIPIYNKMNCFNCDWQCKYSNDKNKPFPCISSITTKQVWETLKQILGKTNARENK